MRFRDVLFDFVKGCLMSFLPCKLFHIFQLHQVGEFLGFNVRLEINILKEFT